jgi:hypothetical protein
MRWPLAPLTVAAALAVLVRAADAQALTFTVIPDDGFGSRVLLIHDCYRIKSTLPCEQDGGGFARGDPARLAAKWREGPFAEVWLLSGGGDLNAGIAIANDLRAHAQAVRVPNAARLLKASIEPTRAPACISSCTVAFMGGQFRTIDMVTGDAATYKVHASSSVSWGDPDEEKDYIAQFFSLLNRRGLEALVAELTGDDRTLAARLFCVFQDTLWLTIKKSDPQDPERRRRDQVLRDWERERQGYRYPPAQAARDRAILTLEGQAALQDILMRAERESMSGAINQLRSLAGGLGRRADAALAMLAAMYDTSSILETNNVPKETLTRMGYLTEFVR